MILTTSHQIYAGQECLMPSRIIQENPLNLLIQTDDTFEQELLLGDVFFPNNFVPNDINKNSRPQTPDDFEKLFLHHQ